VYRVLSYNPYTLAVTVNLAYTATDTGSIVKNFQNYVINLAVECGLPITHKWQSLKPMREVETIRQLPNNNGVAIFDVSGAVQTDISTENNIKLISLPNDINLWTSILVAYNDEYDTYVGASATLTYAVAGTADNGGRLELQIPTTNGINIGDYVIITSLTSGYSGAVLRVIEKNTSNGDITLDTAYNVTPTITNVAVFDVSLTRTDNAYTDEGTTYYTVNNKLASNRYGANLAPKVNVDGNSDLADNLSNFERMGKYKDLFSDFTSIMDASLLSGLSTDDLPALEVTQYDQNGAELSTDYFTVTNQDEGVYRWLYTGGLTKSVLSSLNFNNEVLNQVIPVIGEFISMQVSTPFNKMLTANLTYQYNTTNTWGSQIINTTDLSTFNAGMVGRPIGFIRIVTSQSTFIEGGLIIQIDYVGNETNTSAITAVMPANRIDQDLVLYCQNFQINTLSSSQAGDQYAYGVRTDDVDAVDWTTFSTLAALTSLSALNTAIKTSAFKAVQIWFSEGTANTGANAKTISITGQFTDSRDRGYVGLLDRLASNNFRTALANNGKIYDGSVDYDTITSFSQMDYDTAFTFFAVVLVNTQGAQGGYLYNTAKNIVGGGKNMRVLIVATTNIIRLTFGQTTEQANRTDYDSTLKVKLGYNVIAFTYDGLNTASSCNFYINGNKEVGTRTRSNNGAVSVTNAEATYIGHLPITGFLSYFNGRIRKYQIINRVLTAKEIRQVFLSGSCETIVDNADFRLDVDFNKTGTSALTTRASTPTFTLTAFGGAAYTTFIT
jgi:hypothetical protein